MTQSQKTENTGKFPIGFFEKPKTYDPENALRTLYSEPMGRILSNFNHNFNDESLRERGAPPNLKGEKQGGIPAPSPFSK